MDKKKQKGDDPTKKDKTKTTKGTNTTNSTNSTEKTKKAKIPKIKTPKPMSLKLMIKIGMKLLDEVMYVFDIIFNGG